MARTFASGDKIRCSTGNAGGLNGAVALAILVKQAASRDGAWRNHLAMLDSGGVWSHGYAFEFNPSNQAVFDNDSANPAANSTTTTTSADNWCLHVITKAAGSATPRYHRYKYSTGAWVHEAMSGTVADATPGAGNLVEIGGDLGGSGDLFVGDIAVAGCFNAALADQDVEALAFTLQQWFGSTRGLWPLDQSATGQKVVDFSGGGANESALTGTSASTLSVPVFNVTDGAWIPALAPAAGGTTWFGSSTVSLTDTITTAGTRKTFATSTVSETATVTTAGTRKTFATSTVAELVTVTTAGKRTATGVSSVNETVTVTTAGKLTAKGVSTVPIVVLITTAGTGGAAAGGQGAGTQDVAPFVVNI